MPECNLSGHRVLSLCEVYHKVPHGPAPATRRSRLPSRSAVLLNGAHRAADTEGKTFVCRATGVYRLAQGGVPSTSGSAAR